MIYVHNFCFPNDTTFQNMAHDYYLNFHPLELVKRTRARKTSDEVQKKTVRKRSKVVSETRTAVSGGAAGT